MKLLTFAALISAALATLTPESSADSEYEISDAIAANKIAVVVLPDAAKKALASAPRAGQDMWLAVHLLLGNPTGLRIEAFPYTSKDIKVGVEAIAGEQSGSLAAGTGVRMQIRVTSHHRDAFYASPGVDVYFSPPTTHGLGHYQTIYYVAGNADFSWLHEFSDHFGFELGLELGAEVALNTPAWLSTQHAAILPDVAIFTGVRF